MSVLLLGGCFLLLWHHPLLQRLPRWLPANDQCPQGGTASLSCRCCWRHFFGNTNASSRTQRTNGMWKYLWHCFFPPQGQKVNSWRERSAHCTWFTHRRGRSLPWAAGSAETPIPSKLRDCNWKPVFLLWFLPAGWGPAVWGSAPAWSRLLDTGPSFCPVPRVFRSACSLCPPADVLSAKVLPQTRARVPLDAE